MVQIIQSGPSSVTLRQRALDEALGTITSGISNYQNQEDKKAQNLRQKALQDFEMANDLRKQGYDVTEEQVSQAFAPQKEQNLWDKITGKEIEKTAPVDLRAKRTTEWTTEHDRKKSLQTREDTDYTDKKARDNFAFDQEKKEADLRLQKMKAENERIQNDNSLSPYTKRKMMAETQKAEAEAQKTMREIVASPTANKLSKLGGETQNKVGSIASGLKAIGELKSTTAKGVGPSYIDANTPIIGNLLSDNEFTQNQRVLDEVVGRLQSGGAIGADEEKRFRSMGPRPGDSPELQAKKLEDQRTFLLNKLTAFGIKEEELAEMGFDIGQSRKSVAPVKHPEVDQAAQWAKQNPNDPRAKEILKRIGV